MKPSYSRRFSRRSRSSAHPEAPFFKKESAEPAFFDAAPQQAFFAAAPSSQTIQRKCAKCEDEDKQQSGKAATMPDEKRQEEEKKSDDGKKVMRKEAAHVPVIANAASLAGPGAETSLPATANRFFSRAFGRDFSDVKIHTGPEANRAAKSVHAKAYTLGEHIVFADGAYAPESGEGKELLAHELAHVVQQKPERLSRKEEEAAPAEGPVKDALMGFASISGSGRKLPPERAFANCAGASVSGFTDANYDHGSYSVTGAAMKQSKGCEGCVEAECVSVSGIIVSTFKASPAVTLPSIPPGNWSDCEKTAIQNFINTTLSRHEQQHVAAFNTYNGTVKTPFSYTGCKDGLDAHVASIHDGINASREAAATAKSDLLDANGANRFTIACDCPDPTHKEGDKNSQ